LDKVGFAGGLARGDQDPGGVDEKQHAQASAIENWSRVEQEVWGMISGHF